MKLRRMLKSGEYGRAFVDEYWIGSKPTEHKIILVLYPSMDMFGSVLSLTVVFSRSMQIELLVVLDPS